MQTAKELIARLLAPPHCVFCKQPTGRAALCAPCYDELPWLHGACPRCAQPRAGHGDGVLPCGTCQQRPPPFTAAAAPLHYEYPVDGALKALKFRSCLYYAPVFAGLLLPLMAARFAEVDALVPVPLYRWRHARRGFNQADELCRPLARASGVPMLRSLRRVRATRAHSGLDRAARRRNLHGAFASVTPLTARYPLIVDDVMTTGETCRQLAHVLLAAGAERVGVLTVARAGYRRDAADYANV